MKLKMQCVVRMKPNSRCFLRMKTKILSYTCEDLN